MNTLSSFFFDDLAIPRAVRRTGSPPLSRPIPLAILLLGVCGALLAGCASSDPSPNPLGQVALALETASNGQTYVLKNANFLVEGTESLELSSAEAGASAELVQELSVGDYTVELQPGWSLVALDASENEHEVAAELASINPVAFSIIADQSTAVGYRFSVEAGPVEFGSGQLALSFDVDVQQPARVFISEIMKNPSAVADSAGEYIELSNVGAEAFSLQGCTLARDTQSFTVDAPVAIEAGGSVALANSDMPGFSPAFVYSGLSLPNSSAFLLELSCASKVLDQVAVDPATFPNAAGKSMSLSPTAWSASANDVASAWCDASEPLGTDFGSPGASNSDCAPAQ